MTKASPDVQVRLVRWSALNATVMVAGTMLVLIAASLKPSILFAAVSFGTLVWRCRTHWTPRGRFGAANA